MKMKFKDFEFDIPIYGMSVQVNFKDKLECSRLGVVYEPTDEGDIVVDFVTEGLSNSILVHEAVHIAFYISKYIGLPVNEDNDEFIAYMTEFIFDNLIEGIG